jgi:hypothetical protein
MPSDWQTEDWCLEKFHPAKKKVKDLGPELYLHCGDFGGGRDGSVQAFADGFSGLAEVLSQSIFFISAGNHDAMRDTTLLLNEFFEEVYFPPRGLEGVGSEHQWVPEGFSYIDYGGVRYISVGASQDWRILKDRQVTRNGLRWLEGILRESKEKGIKNIIFLAHSGPYGARERLVRDRDGWVEITDLCNQYVAIFFKGNNHSFQRTYPLVHTPGSKERGEPVTTEDEEYINEKGTIYL